MVTKHLLKVWCCAKTFRELVLRELPNKCPTHHRSITFHLGDSSARTNLPDKLPFDPWV
ncbi:mCG1051001 [Mus musculus]|nr:mCG1051001 [Mus musculus]